MASFVSHFNQIPCTTFSVNPPYPSKPSFSNLNPSGFGRKSVEKSSFSLRLRPLVKCLEEGLTAPVVHERERLKTALVALFAGTERGLNATSETRAQIVELVAQLEAQNPNPKPTQSLTLLTGKWILAYTTFAGLFPLMWSGMKVPFVKVDEISEAIDSDDFSVENFVQFGFPLATICFGTKSKFQVQTPKRLRIKLEEAIVGAPKLTSSIKIPEEIELFGQTIDLSSLKEVTTAVEEGIKSQTPFKFPISNTCAEPWLVTTFLDEDVRISWGDCGNLFILTKQPTSLSKNLL